MAKSKGKKAAAAAGPAPEAGRKGGINKDEAYEKVFRIETIEEDPEKASPVVAYIPSGYDLLKHAKTGPGCDSKRIQVFSKSTGKNPRMHVVVNVPDSDVKFVGTNYSGEATAPQLCNYALGLVNKSTGILKLVPIASNRVFCLDVVHGETDTHDEPKPETTDRNDKPDALENITDYLSKRDVNRMFIKTVHSLIRPGFQFEKRKALQRTQDDSENHGEMDEKLKGLKKNANAVKAIDDAAAANNDAPLGVPPYDLEAATPDRAYPLEKIILPGEWDHLRDIYDLSKSGSQPDPETYPSFVCNRFHKLNQMQDDSAKATAAGILSYITHLVKFKDMNSEEGISSSRHHQQQQLPSIFRQKFVDKFGTVDKRRRIPENVHRELMSYVLVLSLFVDDFQSDPSDISRDLKINPVTARQLFEYLGCKFVRQNSVLKATLPVPLKFKTLKRKRRGRG
ncbi:hypothetical protein M569_09915 [Genlisea aurea]|uniref:DNA-directed RNA polymerase I subunit rpa49 n=1 Tax=Genlisea aurea TaxID=192259 RepID=S8CD58_9LAMI|nr:hypothetical protein M569_09915 [Genlisea aurea]